MESYMGTYMSRTPSTKSIEDSIIKAQFQQKQMQEKEAKLLQMLDSQQQKALQKAGLNGVLPPSSNRYSTNMNVAHNNNNNLLMNGNGNNPVTANVGAGKVRQMFEERRKNGGTLSSSGSNGYGSRNGALTGIDKGHPLEPLVVTSHSGGSNKSRSSSSKSDPANYTNATRNTQAPPITRPVNLGSSNRATSLSRDRSVSRESQPPAHSSSNSVSSANSTSSSNGGGGGGGKPYHQRQHNKSSASHPPLPPQNAEDSYHDYIPPLPTTTKYSDYAQELEKRENALANKLKKTSISSPDADYYASNSNGGRGSPHKSTSPTNRSVTNSSVRSTAKPPAAMSTPGTRASATGRNLVSSTVTSKKASTTVATSAVKKTGGFVKSKPSPPPRSTTGPPPGSEECKICGRYFDSSRISKHEQICKKTSTKKRKVFNATKMRMEGTEAEPYIRVVSAKSTKTTAPAPSTASSKKSNWRKKHEEFIATIRAAKEYQAHVAKGGDPNDLPPPPPTDTSDYIQCPYCNRKFSEGAAERHIPKCKNIKSNKR